jgi:hypothetical protein
MLLWNIYAIKCMSSSVFLLLSSILLYGYTVICLLIHLLMIILIFPVCMCMCVCVCVCVCVWFGIAEEKFPCEHILLLLLGKT